MELNVMNIVDLVGNGVSLPILVWVWMMVRSNAKIIKLMNGHNAKDHAGLDNRIDRLPCQRDPTNPGFCPEKR